jgi:hypothetical protein
VASAQLPPSSATFKEAAVTVPLRVVHGLIVVPVYLNKHPAPLQLILDTGAPVILIPDTALATKLDLQIVGQARVGGAGDGEAATAPLASSITARVGGLEVNGAFGIIGIAGDVIPGVDGVIGAALFRHSIVEVDWDAKVVRFHDPSSGSYRAEGAVIPLRVERSQHTYVPGKVVIGRDTVNLDMHLDTGARQALSLAPSTIARLTSKPPLAIPTIVGFGSRGIARGDVIRTDALLLGNLTRDSVVTAVPANEPADAGRVGLPILRNYNFAVDYHGGRLLLRPRREAVEAPRFTTTGLVLFPGRDSTERVVAHVIPTSPAAEAGLVPGDTIVSIGERRIVSLDESGLDRAILTPQTGTPILITLRRSGSTLAKTITPRTLLP